MKRPVELPFLPVEPGNILVLTDSTRQERKGMDKDDDFYDEVTPEGVIVARYHVWNHMNIYPPQRTDLGWKKFNLAGEVVAKGKH